MRQGSGSPLPSSRPRDHWRGVANSRTLVSAYLKGGVGETTLAANLGAYLRSGKKCVLPIDLDFQGSLSSMLFGQELAVRHASKLAGDRLISGDRAPVDVPLLAPKVGLKTGEKSPGRLEVVAAYCDLAEADNRIMVEWLSMAASMRPFQGREIYATPRASIELAHSLAEATAATGRRRGTPRGCATTTCQGKQKLQAAIADDEKVRRSFSQCWAPLRRCPARRNANRAGNSPRREAGMKARTLRVC
jgi:hypothetical protein